MAMTQPPTTTTTGVRQSAVLAITDPSAVEGLDIVRQDVGRSGGRDGETLHRLLHDRQIDHSRKHAEQDREPPDEVIGAGALERKAAEQDAEEAADLMAEEGEPVEHAAP